MSDDLITSLRALAAARHDDLSIAVDAVIEIERLRAANKQLVDGIDTITRRKQEEIERLRAERDALRDAARKYLTTLGGAMKAGKFQMGGSAEMAHFVRQAMQKLGNLVFDRNGPRPAGLERLHEPHGKAS